MARGHCWGEYCAVFNRNGLTARLRAWSDAPSQHARWCGQPTASRSFRPHERNGAAAAATHQVSAFLKSETDQASCPGWQDQTKSARCPWFKSLGQAACGRMPTVLCPDRFSVPRFVTARSARDAAVQGNARPNPQPLHPWVAALQARPAMTAADLTRERKGHSRWRLI